ncbi:hypothetical protein FQN57_003277 [Myotisia sp. PD_48]|nr:hypothetical protein FQN57_003277 [Myotisia sp. PD_48]
MNGLFYLTTLLCALVGVIEANPHQKLATTGQFTAEQIGRPVYRDPVAHYYNTLQKHRRIIPNHVFTSLQPRRKILPSHVLPSWQTGGRKPLARHIVTRNGKENGTVDVAPSEYDMEYFTMLHIGGKPDKGGKGFVVNIDTGSGDLWVASTQLPHWMTRGKNLYKPGPTAKELKNHSWTISYLDGSNARGNVYLDTVTFANLTTDSQAVEAASWISPPHVKNEIMDGVLGLAFKKVNQVRPNKQNTFFENVKDKLDRPVFTSFLKHRGAGTFDFGFLDRSKYVGDITYVPVNSSRGMWETSFQSTLIGDQAVVSEFSGLVDSGSSYILLPEAITKKYWESVPGTVFVTGYKMWKYPCAATLPNLTLHVKGYNAVIPGKHVQYRPEGPDSKMCFGGLQGIPNKTAILGIPFLKSQFVVFDAEGPKLGFAKQSNKTVQWAPDSPQETKLAVDLKLGQRE